MVRFSSVLPLGNDALLAQARQPELAGMYNAVGYEHDAEGGVA